MVYQIVEVISSPAAIKNTGTLTCALHHANQPSLSGSVTPYFYKESEAVTYLGKLSESHPNAVYAIVSWLD